MKLSTRCVPLFLLVLTPCGASGQDQAAVQLPPGVRAIWGLSGAHRESSPSRERLCINGLWRWQPAAQSSDRVPDDNWGYFKVPGCWPGRTDWLQKDSQTLYAHPSWRTVRPADISAAWYQREITIPKEWADRRIMLYAEYVSSFADVYVDGKRAGEIRFPAGDVDLTGVCRPGATHLLSLAVTAMPLKGVMLSFSDTNAAKTVKGSVERKGLCGDVYLVSTPSGPRIDDVRIDTSVRKGEIAFRVEPRNLAPGAAYMLKARISDHGRAVAEFTSKSLTASDLSAGRLVLEAKWRPDKVWDIITPQNQHEAQVSLLDATGRTLDTSLPVRFGYRELWIHGRDFYLNGTRIFLSALPIDSAAISAATATYDAARETLLRLKSVGINLVYTHNYGCEPGTHLSFGEILRAADDVGMLVSFSQPHFAQYDWRAPDADQKNGYARDAAFYGRAAGSHPSVVMYSMSHNATGYGEDINPDMIDGIHAPRQSWGENGAKLALRAEAIVSGMDASRIVYHHSSGNLGSMHDVNFYTNFAPMQELDDWFEHWATVGVKPMFTCEYMVPCTWDWTMYRGWYKGKRAFGEAVVPWDLCLAEWNAQFMGDRAYKISEPEKVNLRWEAQQFREGRLWHRWDYPHQVGDKAFDDRHEVIGRYLTTNWRAFRTWGLSANSPWEFNHYWTLRPGVDKTRVDLPVDWDHLQRPGYSPDYLGERFDQMDLAFERSDWIPTADGKAILRNNQSLLAYIGGKPGAFTSKDHNFTAGETVEKQLIIINNSRLPVTANCRWSLGLPQPVRGAKIVTIQTGDQVRIPLRFVMPSRTPAGRHVLAATVRFSNGESQSDTFAIDVLRRAATSRASTLSRAGAVRAYPSRIALYDPKGETAKLLTELGIAFARVQAATNLAAYDTLVIGKGALGSDSPAPDIRRVRSGLKVIVFEQTADALQNRLGFRVVEYGLRQVFKRVPDHPLLAGLGAENLLNWRGSASITAPRLKYYLSPELAYTPAIKWCGIEVSHVWRCGNRGNVASVLIEKPPKGDFLPILDGGFSLQYSPLMEYREGRGMVLLCQVDVTGRTEGEPAARILAENIVRYVSAWKPAQRRTPAYLGGAVGRRDLEHAGIAAAPYSAKSLSRDRVLILGSGGGKDLQAAGPDIARFLQSGGRIMAVGLDDSEATATLPLRLGAGKAEHIASYFQAPTAGSPFAGVGPADIHNRDPRKMTLISSGAAVVGDGVLAAAQNGRIVFCQLAPWDVGGSDISGPDPWERTELNLRQNYRRWSFALSRLLGNLGVSAATPLLDRFAQPVKAETEARWLDGLYLDKPIDWDDPYRFFRW